MSYFDFFISVNEKLTIFIIILVSVLSMYYFIFRKTVISVLDPLFLVILSSCLGSVVVLFLYITERIENIYFYSYLLTQSALYTGFFLFRRTKPFHLKLTSIIIEKEMTHDNGMRLMFYLMAMVNIVAQLIIYTTVGIPIFLESRLEIYVVGGGFGIINRILQICYPVSLYCTMYYLLTRINGHTTEKLLARFYLVVLVIFGLLSGSRSFVLPMVYGFYFFLFLHRGNCKKSVVLIYAERGVHLVTAIIVLMFLSIGIKSQFDLLGIVGTIAERVVSYGDVYFAAYPNRLIEQIQGVGTANFLFGDLLRTLRLVPPQFVQQPIGFEIYNLANKTVEVLNGPNPRHNVLGYINWGFSGSIVFSFICGILLSLGRNIFYTSTFKSHKAKIVVMLLFASVVNIETDPPLFISSLNNIFLMGLGMLILEFIFEHSKKAQNFLGTQSAMEQT